MGSCNGRAASDYEINRLEVFLSQNSRLQCWVSLGLSQVYCNLNAPSLSSSKINKVGEFAAGPILTATTYQVFQYSIETSNCKF